MRLSIIDGVNLIEGSAIFLDEIQEVYKYIRSNNSNNNETCKKFCV